MTSLSIRNRLSSTPRFYNHQKAQWKQTVKTYYQETFDAYEQLFSALAADKSWTYRAEPLRQPLIFYYGHTAAFFVNKLTTAGLIDSRRRVDGRIESLVATGVDEMTWDEILPDDFSWPTHIEMRAYRQEVRHLILNFIEALETPDDFVPNSPWWILMMCIEHERIHLETSAVILRRLPLDFVRTPTETLFLEAHPEAQFFQSGLQQIGASYVTSQREALALTRVSLPDKTEASGVGLTRLPGGKVNLGRGLMNATAPHSFYGWDNEFGNDSRDLSPFLMKNCLITNAEFFSFWKDDAYNDRSLWSPNGWTWAQSERSFKRPLFWNQEGTKLRLLFSEIEMPWDHPVEVNYFEAEAYVHWLNRKLVSEQPGSEWAWKLPTEAEFFHSRQNLEPSSLLRSETANTGLSLGSTRACSNNLMTNPLSGNLWQCASSCTYPFKNFETHPVYEDFTIPTFDGQHAMIMGGSFASAGNEETMHARYAFRRHFYQFAGIRLVLAPANQANTESAGDGGAVYESDAMTGLYNEFHYGPASQHVPEPAKKNFSLRCAELAIGAYKKANPNTEPLLLADIGCATGRASFELARLSPNSKVLGVDFSTKFIQMAQRLQLTGSIGYSIPKQGSIDHHRFIAAADLNLDASIFDRIHFSQGDAHNLSKDFKHLDLVLAANLIDRLHDPSIFLEHICERINSKGVLVLTTPFTWLEEYTNKNKWIGARQIDGEFVSSERALTEFFLAKGWQKVVETELPFYIRETERKGQYTIAYAVAWAKP
ncbi:MAG: 5-histidylcysteine sulfoxide synthase [Bdellovibrio sp.]